MSESEFENLIDDPPLAVIKKQLDHKNNQINLLKQQITQKNTTIEETQKQREYYQISNKQKELMIKSLMAQTFKLSLKIVALTQSAQKQTECLQVSQLEKQELLESQVKEKEDLLRLIDELAEQLKKEQEEKSMLAETLTRFEREKQDLSRMSQLSQKQRIEAFMEHQYHKACLSKCILEKEQDKHILQKELQVMTTAKKSLQQELALANKNTQETKRKHNQEKQQDRRELQQCREEIAYIQSKLNVTTEYSTQHIKIYQQTLKKMEEQQNNYKKLFQEKQFKINELSQKVNQNDDEIEQLKIQLKEKQTEMITFQLVINELQSQLISPKPNRKQSEASDTQSIIEKQKIQIKNLQQDITQFQEIMKHLCEEKETYRLENKALKEKIQDMEVKEKLQKLKAQISKDQTNTLSKTGVKQVCKQCQQFQQERTRNNQRIHSLEEQNKQVIELLEAAFSKNKQTEKELEQVKGQIASIKLCMDQELKIKCEQIQRVKQEKKSISDKFEGMKQEKQLLNESMREFFEQGSVCSIEDIYEKLGRISGDIHETASFLEGSQQEKKEKQVQEKNKILQRIRGILFNHGESKNFQPYFNHNFNQRFPPDVMYQNKIPIHPQQNIHLHQMIKKKAFDKKDYSYK